VILWVIQVVILKYIKGGREKFEHADRRGYAKKKIWLPRKKGGRKEERRSSNMVRRVIFGVDHIHKPV